MSVLLHQLMVLHFTTSNEDSNERILLRIQSRSNITFDINSIVYLFV